MINDKKHSKRYVRINILLVDIKITLSKSYFSIIYYEIKMF